MLVSNCFSSAFCLLAFLLFEGGEGQRSGLRKLDKDNHYSPKFSKKVRECTRRMHLRLPLSPPECNSMKDIRENSKELFVGFDLSTE